MALTISTHIPQVASPGYAPKLGGGAPPNAGGKGCGNWPNHLFEFAPNSSWSRSIKSPQLVMMMMMMMMMMMIG